MKMLIIFLKLISDKTFFFQFSDSYFVLNLVHTVVIEIENN